MMIAPNLGVCLVVVPCAASALAVGVFVQTVPCELRTALLAVASFFVVAAGFALGDRAFRIVGLVSLLVAVIRLFARDLSDPIHRIVAFGAGGVLMLILDYFYHALSGRIS
jgi:uncharacterized membrane protein